jgi:type IV pilus assembly protein PilV
MNARRRARGFSLVEVLVALLIIGVGMLGIAKIQAMAYASTGTASLRSLAAIQAASLASSMRANRAYWTNPLPGLSVSVTGGATPTLSINDASLTTTPCNFPTTCATPAATAGNDISVWANTINSVLPSVSALISCPAATVVSSVTQPVECTIQLNWAERNIGINTQSQGTAGITQPLYSYTLYVEP